MKTLKRLGLIYSTLNVCSVLLIGQFTSLMLLTNLLPTLVVFFLLTIQDEKKTVDKKKKCSIIA